MSYFCTNPGPTSTRYDGMMHGFINISGVLDQSKRAFSQIAAELHKAFNKAV